MKLRTEIRNRLEMLGKSIAAELPAQSPANRRWIGVYVVPARHKLDPRPEPPGIFRIRQFELPRHLHTDDYSPFEGDLVDLSDEWANSIEDVERLLSRHVDPALMEVPWKSDYPL